MSVYKSRGSPFDPFTCARAVRATHRGHTWQGRGGKPERSRSTKANKTTPRPRAQRSEGRSKFPRQDPCWGNLSGPDKTLARADRPTLAERASLKPTVSNTINHVGPGLGRHLHGGMQIFVKTKNIQDQIRIGGQHSPSRSLPKKPTRPSARSLPGVLARHGRTLAGPPDKALARGENRATARPAPTNSPPPFACSCQPNQLGRHLCRGMQIFVKTHHYATSATCLPTWHLRHRRGAQVRGSPFVLRHEQDFD